MVINETESATDNSASIQELEKIDPKNRKAIRGWLLRRGWPKSAALFSDDADKTDNTDKDMREAKNIRRRQLLFKDGRSTMGLKSNKRIGRKDDYD